METNTVGGSATNSSTRWSTLGRRSVRNLTSLLKRGGGGGGSAGSSNTNTASKHPQQALRSSHRLSVLDNNCVAGWNCMERGEPVAHCEAVKQQAADQHQKLEPSRIRTTVLGCPKRLRASMPAAARKQQLIPQFAPPSAESAAVSPSPLFEIRRQHQQHRSSSRGPSNRADQPVHGSGGLDCPSDLLLELDGQQRRLTIVGRQLSSPADLWALFASQWPVAVQSLGNQWCIRLQRSDWPSTCWQTLTSTESASRLPQLRRLPPDSRLLMESTTTVGSTCSTASASETAGCSCKCTCSVDSAKTAVAVGGSRLRIERLEEQVTSIARQLDSRRHRLMELRDECQQLRSAKDALRREHDSRTRETRRMFANLSSDVQRILTGWAAGAETTVIVNSEQRTRVEAELESYRQEGAEVSALLDDVDATTSELRHDVLRRRCRSNPAEVELLALHLSRATQRLASLKNRFPELESRTRDLLRQEANAVACDERHLADEQQRLESWLRRVKKLTMMLYTFKQLAEAQAKEAEVSGPRAISAVAECLSTAEDTAEVRRSLLQNIASVCPDHDRRVAEIARAEAAIERRQRMIREAAALKAEKTLTAAASRLKPVHKLAAPVPVPVLASLSDEE